MDNFIIRGGAALEGEVTITGAKNAVLGLIPAAILCDGQSTIENIPNILDVHKIVNILNKLGAKLELKGSVLHLDTADPISYDCSPYTEEMGKMRASYYLMGALLGRYHRAVVPLPGGCNIGDRPIDQHLKGFRALGAEIEIKHGCVYMNADRLVGSDIYMDVVSVGATINIMLAAVLAEGRTTIENVAKEPHVVDVANFLNLMGAEIKGAGTDTIRINGVRSLHGCEYSTIPDQITTGTYMMMAAATGGNILVRGAIPKHMEAVSAKLREMGVSVEEEGDGLRVIGCEKLRPANVKTLPYPGFPTDLQQPMAVLMALAEGRSIINESIYESRFRYVDELRRMGADITVNGRIAHITGVERLTGTKVAATDLRAGAAMVLAGLVAEGTTRISGIHYIERGYENLEENIRSLGGQIERITVPASEED